MFPTASMVKTIIIGGVAYVIYFFEKKYKIIRQLFEDDHESPVFQSKSNIKQNFNIEFDTIAKDFEFLYDELYTMHSKEYDGYDEKYLNSTIMEWELKVKINSKGTVAKVWNELVFEYFGSNWFEDADNKKTNAQQAFLLEWYNQLVKAGIQRDNRELIVVQDYSIHQYYIINEIYKIGDTLAIERPCWLLNEKCIEKGIANISKNA